MRITPSEHSRVSFALRYACPLSGDHRSSVPDTAEEVPNGTWCKRDEPSQSSVSLIATIVKGMLYNALRVEYCLCRWASMAEMLHEALPHMGNAWEHDVDISALQTAPHQLVEAAPQVNFPVCLAKQEQPGIPGQRLRAGPDCVLAAQAIRGTRRVPYCNAVRVCARAR